MTFVDIPHLSPEEEGPEIDASRVASDLINGKIGREDLPDVIQAATEVYPAAKEDGLDARDTLLRDVDASLRIYGAFGDDSEARAIFDEYRAELIASPEDTDQ